MLEITDISLKVPSPEGERALLSNVSARFPLSHFGAIIGPSGCGKTTLLKLVAGIDDGEEEGSIFWKGRNLETDDFLPSEISYVPQFSIAHEELTVRECVDFALRLRVSAADEEQRTATVDQLLKEVRMEEFGEQRVKVLSGGQRRRQDRRRHGRRCWRT